MEFHFDLARAGDDQSIRRLLANTPVPGRVAVTFEREPDYFGGCGTMGRFCQVMVARDTVDQKVVAVACRAARRMFINGQAEEVGYLGQLRVDQQFRGRWLVSRGFRFLHQLHADSRVDAYLATITEENLVAHGLLVARARRHFPAFREVGRICTLSLILRKPKPSIQLPRYDVCRGSEVDLDDIIAFLNRHGSAKQFFPVYTREDFESSRTTLGFSVSDFIIARRGGELAGVIGLWDQSAFKQTVVQNYSGLLHLIKPLYNFVTPLSGARPLPSVRERIRHAYASFICVPENDPEVFGLLLREAYNLAALKRYAYLMVGLSVDDPLLRVARGYGHISYHSKLYAICWGDGGDFYGRLDGRVPYVEVAAL